MGGFCFFFLFSLFTNTANRLWPETKGGIHLFGYNEPLNNNKIIILIIIHQSICDHVVNKMFIGCKDMVKYCSSYSLFYDKVLPGLSSVTTTTTTTKETLKWIQIKLWTMSWIKEAASFLLFAVWKVCWLLSLLTKTTFWSPIYYYKLRIK